MRFNTNNESDIGVYWTGSLTLRVKLIRLFLCRGFFTTFCLERNIAYLQCVLNFRSVVWNHPCNSQRYNREHGHANSFLSLMNIIHRFFLPVFPFFFLCIIKLWRFVAFAHPLEVIRWLGLSMAPEKRRMGTITFIRKLPEMPGRWFSTWRVKLMTSRELWCRCRLDNIWQARLWRGRSREAHWDF